MSGLGEGGVTRGNAPSGITGSTPWEVLGIEPWATTDEIKAAFRRLARLHHPDRGGRHEDMVRINAAMRTLLDPKERLRYEDAIRGGQATGTPHASGSAPGQARPPGATTSSSGAADPTWYPPYDELEAWVERLARAALATMEDVRGTSYDSARIRGIPVPVGDSGSGMVFALLGAGVCLVVLAPIWTFLPVALRPPVVALGVAIGTGVHRTLRFATLDTATRRAEASVREATADADVRRAAAHREERSRLGAAEASEESRKQRLDSIQRWLAGVGSLVGTMVAYPIWPEVLPIVGFLGGAIIGFVSAERIATAPHAWKRVLVITFASLIGGFLWMAFGVRMREMLLR